MQLWSHVRSRRLWRGGWDLDLVVCLGYSWPVYVSCLSYPSPIGFDPSFPPFQGEGKEKRWLN